MDEKHFTRRELPAAFPGQQQIAKLRSAAVTKSMPSGIGIALAAATTTRSASPPWPQNAMTGSPAAMSSTCEPTASTSPATSRPGLNGKSGRS